MSPDFDVLGRLMEAVNDVAAAGREVERIRVASYVQPGEVYLMRASRACNYEALIHPADWRRLLDAYASYVKPYVLGIPVVVEPS